MSADYRINFSIERREEGDDEYREIAWGGTGSWAMLDAAIFEAASQLDNEIWVTVPGVGRG